ncbi:MAG TPA: acyltransferase, partial [Chloroflexota bacterium]|nr:acyltransferase [Chloroflexota bacterium]
MAAEIRGRGTLDRLSYYIHGQAGSVADYLLQGILTTLLGGVPGLPGIALRGLFYRLMLQMDGFAAVEGGVRLRHARGIRLGRNVYLDQGVYLHACPQGIEIGADTYVMHNAELHVFNFRDLPHAFIRVGRGTFIGESVVIRGQGGVSIGDSVLIAPQAKILAVNHNFADVLRPVIDQGITGKGIVIEDGAWIGAGATVVDGVRIGKGSVIGANAVVTKDVPAYCLAVGVPARVIRHLDEAARWPLQ